MSPARLASPILLASARGPSRSPPPALPPAPSPYPPAPLMQCTLTEVAARHPRVLLLLDARDWRVGCTDHMPCLAWALVALVVEHVEPVFLGGAHWWTLREYAARRAHELAFLNALEWGWGRWAVCDVRYPLQLVQAFLLLAAVHSDTQAPTHGHKSQQLQQPPCWESLFKEAVKDARTQWGSLRAARLARASETQARQVDATAALLHVIDHAANDDWGTEECER